MQLTKLIDHLKLPKDARADLERVLDLPEVKAVLGREEAATVEHRRELIKRFADVPAKHQKAIAQATKAAINAADRLKNAEAELWAAKQASIDANNIVSHVAHLPEVERAEILAELQEGRDRRLDDMWRHLSNLDDQVRHLIRVYPQVHRLMFGEKEVKYLDNRSEVESARAALAKGLERLKELAISAITQQEVTEALAEIIHSLAEPLAALEIDTPHLNEHGEVTDPLGFPSAKSMKERIAEEA